MISNDFDENGNWVPGQLNDAIGTGQQPVGTDVGPITDEPDPNYWLYDGSKKPTMNIPGQDWVWTGSQWTTKPIGSNTEPGTGLPGAPNGPNTTPGGLQHPPNFISEADGKAYDQANGLLGGYMSAQGWVHGSPHGGGGGGGGGGTGGGGGGGGIGRPGQVGNLPGPFNFPLLDIPTYVPYADYTPLEWKPPDPKDVYNDPSYQFRFDEGMKPVTNSRALAGLSRGGATAKALMKYGQNFASDEFGRIYDRAADTYDRNELNRKGAYTTNQSNYNTAYDYSVTEAKDEFEPKKKWAELQFGRDWDIFKFQNEQAFNYWNAALGASTQGAQFGNDEP